MPLRIFLEDCCDFQYFHVPCYYNNIKTRVKSCGKYSAWILSVNERLHLFQRIFLLGLKTVISFICFTSQLNFRQECPVGRPEFFLSRPRSSFSRLRWPGAVRAKPWIYTVQLCLMRYAYHKSTTRVVSCKSSLQLACDCCVRDVVGFLKHVLKLYDNRSHRQFYIVEIV